jgi:ABC-type branched-subunit amino acid transport system ATPase component
MMIKPKAGDAPALDVPVLDVQGVSMVFDGFQALNAVSVQCHSGEIAAIIGPNGAGKSTLYGVLSGLLRPTAGRVLVQGRDMRNVSVRQRAHLGIGRTFQVARVFPTLTVAENMALAARMARAGQALSCADILGAAALHDVQGHIVGNLSYGMQKRLEFCMALIQAPKVLLMDEPAAGLTDAEGKALMALVCKMAADLCMAVVFTEHDMHLVFQYAHRVHVLAEGAIIATGTPMEIHANPVVRRIYLGHS